MPSRIWLMLREPREVTAVTLVAWGLFSCIGVLALLHPPQTVEHQLGWLLALVWAVSLILGGVLGLVGLFSGWWWVERSGILATGLGTTIYLFTVTALQISESGNRHVQIGFICVALIFLIVRWLRIRGPQIDPLRGFKRDHADV